MGCASSVPQTAQRLEEPKSESLQETNVLSTSPDNIVPATQNKNANATTETGKQGHSSTVVSHTGYSGPLTEEYLRKTYGYTPMKFGITNRTLTVPSEVEIVEGASFRRLQYGVMWDDHIAYWHGDTLCILRAPTTIIFVIRFTDDDTGDTEAGKRFRVAQCLYHDAFPFADAMLRSAQLLKLATSTTVTDKRERHRVQAFLGYDIPRPGSGVYALVNATDEFMNGENLRDKAGDMLVEACRRLHGGVIGTAKITPAFELKGMQFIIHVVSPQLRTGGEAAVASDLSTCYTSIMQLAETHSVNYLILEPLLPRDCEPDTVLDYISICVGTLFGNLKHMGVVHKVLIQCRSEREYALVQREVDCRFASKD